MLNMDDLGIIGGGLINAFANLDQALDVGGPIHHDQHIPLFMTDQIAGAGDQGSEDADHLVRRAIALFVELGDRQAFHVGQALIEVASINGSVDPVTAVPDPAMAIPLPQAPSRRSSRLRRRRAD
jgi:hypothetical protein